MAALPNESSCGALDWTEHWISCCRQNTHRASLQCELFCAWQDLLSLWSSCHIPHSDVVVPPCGCGCARSCSPVVWSPFHKSCMCRASVQSASSCECANRSAEWSFYHKRCTGMVSPPCASSCGESEPIWPWISCCRCCSCMVCQSSHLLVMHLPSSPREPFHCPWSRPQWLHWLYCWAPVHHRFHQQLEIYGLRMNCGPNNVVHLQLLGFGAQTVCDLVHPFAHRWY